MPNTTMHAIRVHEFGGPDRLQLDRVAIPQPGPGEVLIRVAAAALNPPDWYTRDGLPDVPRELMPPIDLPLVLGTDVSGVVHAVGPGVDAPAVGDEVFGMLRFPERLQAGTYAEYVTAPVSHVARKPAGVDHLQAAGVSMSGLTAWQYLIDVGHDHPSPFQSHPHRPVPLDRDTTVLVNGAAGGVGHVAVQLARWKGARVIAVASGRHEEYLRSIGADEVIDYTKQRPEDVARDVDLVVDNVGGPESRRLLPVLRRGGALFAVYLAEFDDAEIAASGVTTSVSQVRSDGSQLAQLAGLLESGDLRVEIDSTFPLADARAAHERAARGHIRGKILLTVD